MPYGISSTLWAQMAPEDQNQVMADYNAAHNVGYTPPTIGGYVQPTQQQVQAAVAQSGLPASSQAAVTSAYNNGGTAAPAASAPGAPANPGWVYAVNMPSTYPDYEAMKRAGAGLVLTDDDPNLAVLLAGAREHGVSVAIQVNAPPGITPEQYAAKVAQFQQYAPDRLVLDIEAVGNGDPGSAGWNWSSQTASLLKPIVGSTQVAVTMEPHKSDYNYGAYQNLSSGGATQFWVQSYTGDHATPAPEDWSTGFARAAVGDANVVAIFGPNQPPPTNYTGTYVSYGIPQTGVSSAGIYGAGATSNTPYYPGQVPVAGAGSGETTGPPIYVNPGGQYGGGTNTPPPGTTTSGGGSSTSSADWAASYFASFGLPADVASKVNDIFAKYPDTDQAVQFALAYIRGTPWYAQTFPGIQYGMQHGLITNEQDYRQYVTALDTISQRYNGRHITGNEVSQYLMYGFTPDIVGKRYEGRTAAMVNGQDWNYYLGAFSEQGQQGQEGLWSLGEEQAGLDSAVGQRLQRALQQATQRYQKVFEGVLATPALSLGSNGLTAPSLQGGTRGKPDVGS